MQEIDDGVALGAIAIGGAGVLAWDDDGLFFEPVIERDLPIFIAMGTGIFVLSSIVWIWSVFALGSRPAPEEGSWQTSRLRVTAGLICLAAVVVAMFGAAYLQPKKPTLDGIAADRTLTDEQALKRLAQMAFPRNVSVTSQRNPEGVELWVSYVCGKEPSIPVIEGPGSEAPAGIDKAAAALPLLRGIQKIIQHGRARNLSGVRASLTTFVLGEDGKPHEVEAYRVSVPSHKFDGIMQPRVTRDLLLSTDRIFAQLAVVEVDNFPQFNYRAEP